MPDQVNVEDFEAFSLFRAALFKFAQAAEQSLATADSQIARTHSWLENEQASFWHSQLKRREEAVVKARDAVRQKKLYKDATGRFRDAMEEEKHLQRCLAAVDQAREKIEFIKKSIPRLEKASELYRSGVSRLSKTLADDIPRATALLDRHAQTLEQYIQIEAPAPTMPDSAMTNEPPESLSRGGETQAAPSASPDKTPANPSEAPHVRHG